MEKVQQIDEDIYTCFNDALNSEKEHGDGYEQTIDEFGLKAYKKDCGDSGILVKTYMQFHDISAEELATILLTDELRKVWDPNFKNPEVVEKLSDNADIYYFVAESPVPLIVSKRDFLSQRYYLKGHGGVDYFSYLKATEHPSKPVQNKIVRGKFKQFARIIRKDASGKGSTLTIIMSNDFGGSIPKWVINKKAGSMPKDTYTNIKKHYPKFKKDGLLEKHMK